MKFFKKLNAYNKQEVEEAVLGIGIIKAKDYGRDKFGHLFILSLNLKRMQFLKKIFIPL